MLTWPASVDFDMDHLVPVENIGFPFLHIKLNLFQKFVKALDKGSDCFQFILKIYEEIRGQVNEWCLRRSGN